ncbi:MAG TPA: phosphotransferase [Caulobacteraceae bacterium]
MIDGIPEDKRPALDSALRTVFGRPRYDTIAAVAGGLSGSGVWRLGVGVGSYLLKLEAPADGFHDPARQYACLKLAAEAGVAPELLHADAEAGLSISCWVEARPLADHPGGRRAILKEMAKLVRRLQATPAFPPLVDFFEGVSQLVARTQALGLADAAQIAEPLERLAEIAEDWRPGQAEPVSSHNDLNPRNVISDGRRLWLVDWGAAFRNDPWVDVAVSANFFASSEDEAEGLLQAYLGAPADAAARARFELMRQTCRLYYGVLILASAAGSGAGLRPGAGWSEASPLSEVQSALGSGRMSMDTPDGRFGYGAALIGEMLRQCHTPGHQRALEVVAGG